MPPDPVSNTRTSNDPLANPADVPQGPGGSGRQSGISGKKITIAMVLVLVVMGGLLGYSLWTYSRLDAARAETATAWRELTDELDQRYRTAEQQVLAADAAPWASAAFQQQFRLAREDFRTTSRISSQQRAAELLESMLGSGRAPAEQWFPVTQGLRQAVEEFNARRQTEEQILSTLGGKILGIFVGFPEPRPFHLAE